MSSSLDQQVRQRIADISVSVTSPRKIVTVTCGQHGQITDLHFPSHAYRGLAPEALAEAVLVTLRRAQAQVREEVATLIAPLVPPHFDISGSQLHRPAGPDESGIFGKLVH